MYFIYVTTNIVNQKKYVGFSSMTKDDWQTYLGSGKILMRAVKKYGEENFSRETLKTFDSKDEAIEYERKFILENNCHISLDWYNIAVGYTTQGFKDKSHTKEWKEARAEEGRLRPASEKMRQNMSAVGKLPKTEKQLAASKENGRRAGLLNRGKKRTPEQRAKLSEAHKKRFLMKKAQAS